MRAGTALSLVMVRRSVFTVFAFSAWFSASLAATSCRFAKDYTPKTILAHPELFRDDVVYWEGKFHQHNVSYNAVNGMTFDGTLLDPITGEHRVSGLHTFSAASKESLHIMLLARVIEGNPLAVKWILSAGDGGSDVEKARRVAVDILQKKWTSYSQFNATYPGFGGFLPWFAHTEYQALSPTWDWANRVPALDNGENIWAIYALVEALSSLKGNVYTSLASQWQGYLNYLSTTAATIFYRGGGRVCAVTSIHNQSLAVNHPDQTYTCEGLNSGGNPYINDPYEGQSFTYFLQLFTSLPSSEKSALWTFKRPQLVATTWTRPGFAPLTVQRGFWYSSHENWGWLQLPYLDLPFMKNLFAKMERVRTCDSQSKSLPGMFASINNSTDASGEIIGYISNAGIPEIASQTIQELDVITPYSTMNTMLVNQTAGLVWWHNMVKAKRMQNLYGSSESTRVDGSATSAFVSWDSKVTTITGLLGGVLDLVRRKMKSDGVYDQFVAITRREYGAVFNASVTEAAKVELCLPQAVVPDLGLEDFTLCS